MIEAILYGARDLRAYMGIPAVAILLSLPIYTTAMLLPTFLPVIPLLALNAILVSLWQGPVYATVQNIAPHVLSIREDRRPPVLQGAGAARARLPAPGADLIAAASRPRKV